MTAATKSLTSQSSQDPADLFRQTQDPDKLDAQKLARLARVDPELLYPIEHRGAGVPGSSGSNPLPRRAGPQPYAADQPCPGCGQVLRGSSAQKCSAESFHRTIRNQLPQELKEALVDVVETISAR